MELVFAENIRSVSRGKFLMRVGNTKRTHDTPVGSVLLAIAVWSSNRVQLPVAAICCPRLGRARTEGVSEKTVPFH